jgi:hypothetical protein
VNGERIKGERIKGEWMNGERIKGEWQKGLPEGDQPLAGGKAEFGSPQSSVARRSVAKSRPGVRLEAFLF